MEAIGFKMIKVGVRRHPGTDGWVVFGCFECVCGKHEFFAFAVEREIELAIAPDELCDPAQMLRRHGSFDRQHLVADGYSEAQVDQILERGRAFDMGNPC